MKLISLLISSAFLLSAASAFAAPTAQQNKMGECQKEATAKGLKNPERQKFVNECLKAAPAAAKAEKAPAAAAAPAADAKKLPPKEAMKACATASKGKKGDEHKKFMSDCLKAGGPASMAK